MGIASSIMEAAWTESRLYPGNCPAKVGVVIGEFAGVDTESLRFCFETLADGLELDITWSTGSDELKLAYLELEEVLDDQCDDQCDESRNGEEGLKRERSNCGTAA
jgi:Zn finger protein HypA/HybF involved in hydrogenase expression